MEGAFEALKQLFKGAAEGKPPAAVPAENPRVASTESKGKKAGVAAEKKFPPQKINQNYPKTLSLFGKLLFR